MYEITPCISNYLDGDLTRPNSIHRTYISGVTNKSRVTGFEKTDSDQLFIGDAQQRIRLHSRRNGSCFTSFHWCWVLKTKDHTELSAG